MKTKSVIITGIVVLLLSAGFTLWHGSSNTVVYKPGETPVGSVVTLDGVDIPFVSIGGVRQYNYFQPIVATSSVFCSIKNPLNATATPLRLGATALTNALVTAQTFDISTSSSAFGSSSPAFVRAYNTGTGSFTAFWTANGTTTNPLTIGNAPVGGNGNSNLILGPTDWITFKIATSSGGTFATAALTGNCSGVIQKI